MIEVFTFRFYAEHAAKHPEIAALGNPIAPGFLRSVSCNRGDETWRRLAIAYERSRLGGGSMFASVSVQCVSRTEDIRDAEYFAFGASRSVEASFEEYGTRYIDVDACAVCGAGGLALPPLHLPVRFLGSKRAALETLGGEVIVPRRVKDALTSGGVPGVAFEEVRAIGTRSRNEAWFRLRVTGGTVSLSNQTNTSLVPFDVGWPDMSPCGHVVGYGLRSQVCISAPSTAGRGGFFETEEYLGVRRGLLRPSRIIIITRDGFEALSKIGCAQTCQPVRVLR